MYREGTSKRLNREVRPSSEESSLRRSDEVRRQAERLKKGKQATNYEYEQISQQGSFSISGSESVSSRETRYEETDISTPNETTDRKQAESIYESFCKLREAAYESFDASYQKKVDEVLDEIKEDGKKCEETNTWQARKQYLKERYKLLEVLVKNNLEEKREKICENILEHFKNNQEVRNCINKFNNNFNEKVSNTHRSEDFVKVYKEVNQLENQIKSFMSNLEQQGRIEPRVPEIERELQTGHETPELPDFRELAEWIIQELSKIEPVMMDQAKSVNNEIERFKMIMKKMKENTAYGYTKEKTEIELNVIESVINIINNETGKVRDLVSKYENSEDKVERYGAEKGIKDINDRFEPLCEAVYIYRSVKDLQAQAFKSNAKKAEEVEKLAYHKLKELEESIVHPEKTNDWQVHKENMEECYKKLKSIIKADLNEK